MIRSMTGFGIASAEAANSKITVEIKSLNSKFLELGLKLPRIHSDKEIFLRNEVNKLIERGKVSLAINLEKKDGVSEGASINTELAKKYYASLKKLADELKVDQQNIFAQVLQMPEVISMTDAVPDEEEGKLLIDTFYKAIKAFDVFRMDEGATLAADLKERIRAITNLLLEIEKKETNRIPQIKEKLEQLLVSTVGSEQVDRNRLEQELIYYIEKFDITEEKVRLRSHCAYFLETLSLPDSNGKKLGFIGQEIGREINTIGSKANDATIQQMVVNMKDELEKIKEQLLNIL